MTATNDDGQTNNQLNMRPKYPKSKPCQVLPNNRLDKEVQMIANSYNIALFVFVSSKYYVKDNHIYPRERTFLLFKIFHILFTNTLCIYRMFTININTLGSMGHYEDECMKILNVVFYVTYFICYTFIFINDVVQQNNYVVLILKIQEIHGYIDCSEKIRSYVMFTYFGVIFTICIDSLIIVAFYMFFDTLYWFDIITTCYCDIMILSFNINYVISMRILDLLKLYLEEWTIEVLRNVGKNDDEQCIKLLKMYQTIIEAYNLHATIFEKLILTHILVSVSQSLVLVYSGINSISSAVSKFYTFDLFFWFFKNSSLAVMHSVCCERFYIRIEDAQSACIQLVNNRNYSHSQQHLCRNVLATNRTFSRMNACGLFSVGATLAISLLATVTQYSIIILQFNLL